MNSNDTIILTKQSERIYNHDGKLRSGLHGITLFLILLYSLLYLSLNFHIHFGNSTRLKQIMSFCLFVLRGQTVLSDSQESLRRRPLIGEAMVAAAERGFKPHKSVIRLVIYCLRRRLKQKRMIISLFSHQARIWHLMQTRTMRKLLSPNWIRQTRMSQMTVSGQWNSSVKKDDPVFWDLVFSGILHFKEGPRSFKIKDRVI